MPPRTPPHARKHPALEPVLTYRIKDAQDAWFRSVSFSTEREALISLAAIRAGKGDEGANVVFLASFGEKFLEEAAKLGLTK